MERPTSKYLTSLLDERRAIRICHGRGTRECYSQVGSHNDLQAVPPAEVAFEELGVLDGLFCRMDRAGTDDDECAVVVVLDDRSGGMTCSGDRQARLSRRLDLCSGQVDTLYSLEIAASQLYSPYLMRAGCASGS